MPVKFHILILTFSSQLGAALEESQYLFSCDIIILTRSITNSKPTVFESVK
jgi:hypothetical protein